MAQMTDEALLEAAREGDRDAFASLIEPYRSELHAHCYRMLGSVHDADDALQDTTLRAWQKLYQFAGRSTLRAWLYSIATNTCLNVLRRPSRKVLPLEHGPASDPDDAFGLPPLESHWIEPYPDSGLSDGYASPEAHYEQRESVELAFIATLQHLPPNQRATLILREVLGFAAREVAELLDTSVPSVNSALQRARATLDDRLPDRSQQETLRSLGDNEISDLVSGYVDALERGDVDAVVDMLTDEATWSMPPLPAWFTGDALPRFIAANALSPEFDWRYLATRVNGQPAVARYAWQPDAQAYLPFGIDVLTLDGTKIRQITTFITRETDSRDQDFYDLWPLRRVHDLDALTEWYARFGLPGRVD